MEPFSGDTAFGEVPESGETRMTQTRSGAPEGAAAAPSEGLGEGDVLEDGRFTLVKELGHGGMGRVFKALDRNRKDFQDRHPYIALKLISEEFQSHPDARMALERETVRAQSLAHPNILTVFDFDYEGDHAYMTMELLEGQTLQDWLQDESASSASLALRWRIVRCIGAGLAYAHENGVVHSDLKPGNVFLCKSGAVKVMDFGIARPLRGVAGQTETTRFDAAERLGGLTPDYAPLEQWNREAPDPRDDIYAFGCVVYHLYSGKHPFGRILSRTDLERRREPQRIPSLTRRQWDVLRRALALKRPDRVATVEEFLHQFAPLTWWGKHRVTSLTVGALIIATGLFFGAQYYHDYVEDQSLNAQLWPKLPDPQLTPDARTEIDDDLYMAQGGLRQATSTDSPAELSALLSKGHNSVLYYLKRLYTLQPSNADALKLRHDATQLYAKKAGALLSANRPADALRLVLEGQAIQHTFELFRLKREICHRAAALCAG
jgi:serine/threonine protein kinase